MELDGVHMEEQLRKEGLDGVSDYHTWFEITFQRDGIPVHFFRKSEIEAAMRAADVFSFLLRGLLCFVSANLGVTLPHGGAF